MTDSRDRGNGRDRDEFISRRPPPRPAVREMPRVSPGDTPEMLGRKYGTIAAAYAQHIPGIYDELDEMRTVLVALPDKLELGIDKAVRAAIAGEREFLREVLTAHVHKEIRQSVPATEELEATVKHAVKEAVADTGPQRAITPRGLKAMVLEANEDIEKDEALERERARTKAEEAAKEKAKEERRRFVAQVAATVTAAAILAAGGFFWGQCSGRAAGIAEGKAVGHPTEPPAAVAATAAAVATVEPLPVIFFDAGAPASAPAAAPRRPR